MHVSLDSALGRQRRLNSVGESVLQIAPSAAAAYSLRSLTGGDPKVVRVRRVIDNGESDFTASGISSGALVDFVNAIQTVGTAVNGTGSFDNYTVSNLSTTGFSADNSAGGTGSAGFPYVFKDEDVIVVKYTVTNFSSTSGLSPQIRGVNATSSVTGKTNSGTAFTANGTYTDTLTATANGTHLMYADGNTGSYTISDFEIVSHSSSGFVETWYDQSGNGPTNDVVQTTAANQPKIVDAGSLLTAGITFDGGDSLSVSGEPVITASSSGVYSAFSVQTVATSEAGYLYGNASASNGSSLYSAVNEFSLSNKNVANLDNIPRGSGQNLLSAVYNNGDAGLLVNGAGTMTDAGTYGFAAGTSDFIIGNRNGGTTAGTFLIGSINEIIIYNSNQSDNRTALETNMNSHYSIF